MCIVYLSHFAPTSKSKHQTEHAAGLQLLSHALFDYANLTITPEELQSSLKTGAHGKPYLASHEDLAFNISHCSDIVACAIGHSPIGVDVEEIRNFPETILRRVLTEEEKVFLHQMSSDSQSRNEWFYRLWTLKESRIKHSGMGLAMELTSFSFSYNLDIKPYEISCSDKGLSFFQEIIEGQYVLSLCSNHSVSNVKVIHHSI